jgi:hypothetical protein
MKIALCVGVVIALCGWTRDEDFDKAATKAAGMSKYAFKLTVKSEGGQGRGLPPADVKVDKDLAAEIKAGDTTVYKKGETLVVKEGEEWKKYERVKGAKGDRKNPSPAVILEAVKLPHEEIAEFEKKFKEAKKADEKDNGCTVFSGELTEQGASSLGNAGGKGKAQMSFTGTAKVWVNADGLVVKYSADLTGKGKRKDQDVEVKVTRTVELSDFGTAKVEVPEGAKKLFAGAE